MKKMNQSRRTFLKKGSIAGVGLASFGSLPASAWAEAGKSAVNTRTVVSAAHWGPLGIVVEDEKVVKSGPAIEAPVTNELQEVVPEQVHTKTRVKYPMVRKSYLENPGKSDTSLRGRDEWVRVSWDKALELVHTQLQDVRKREGASGIFAGSYGWKSSGALHSCRTLLHRFMNVTGGFVGHKGDYSTGAAQIIMPHVLGTIEVYEQQTSWETILSDSEIVVLWSANPMTTLRIAWTSTDQQGIAYYKKLKESGKRVICIDPVRSETCEYLGAEWIPLHTATDVPLMLGMAHTLIVENKLDKDFLKHYTKGYDKFEPYVLGQEDGVVKDAAWASQICGVPAETIRQLALDFASHRTMLMAGWGMQRQQHGEQAHWMLVTLASMLGQIGLPGGGFGLSYHYSNGGVPTTTGGKISAISANTGSARNTSDMSWKAKVSGLSFPLARIADVLLNPGEKIDFNGATVTYPDIKFIYWTGGNPFVHHQDTNKLVKAWQRPETIVVNEIYWTPTARMADIVLPVTTSYERNDLTMSGDYSNLNIFPMKKVVEPQFEARNDYDVFAQLAKMAGVEEQFTEGKSEMDWLREFYQTAFDSARQNRVVIPRFDDFWEENKPLTFKAKDKAKQWVRYGDFRKDPLLNPLGTPSGKIEIYSDVVAKMNYDDCKGHAMWFVPEEYAGNVTDEAPLALITPHPYYRLHSQLCFSEHLRGHYTVQGREPIVIHPDDAKARGINDGDVVRVFNKRGQVLAGAVVSDGVIKGTVCLHEGAWFDPAELNGEPICKFGNPNVLTIDKGSSKLAQATAPNTAIVQVEKFTGTLPPVTVFDEPQYKTA
ncbi:trimethylamine-N-oxide reductase TorA [Pasteurellaceae bacterium 20609_3]|uniref:trimethylamine-N-oxide reductase TorA n=1 Tax=Spirabiliibacterium mucosae TaxID=28156 RepID=UPI001AAD2B20|nr:trimethylamine-N-oxide reductase TorA [Spirabiliibacterium mucosae]MBE2898518.1 trimethylamine-N-oxide reductase TorA [Spirabiliibacterium mucosae]